MSGFYQLFEMEFKDSFAVKRYKSYKNIFSADKTWGCISQTLNTTLSTYNMEETKYLFDKKSDFVFSELGKCKTAVFVNVSDTDRSFDGLINVFYTQAIHELCSAADNNDSGSLDVPVRIIMDDFATNVYIPDFDKIISVIRSRNISVSIILQSISQLETLYTKAQAQTIINGFDHLLYLGGQDVDTADYIGAKANKTQYDILNMKINEAYFFERGEFPKKIERIFIDN